MNRLEQFIRARAAETYAEPLSAGHTNITEQMMPLVMKHVHFGPVLDVGCGQGPALKLFKETGRDAIGIALSPEDVNACAEAGYNVEFMDQNDMPDGWTGKFALVWARHVLEHSVIPFFTLTEFARVLAPGGVLYAEMPAPGTAARHEFNNPNHYSVLTSDAWVGLIVRSGFTIIEAREIGIETGVGPDKYFSYVCRKI
jgi:SAM-dependent methyltransferase